MLAKIKLKKLPLDKSNRINAYKALPLHCIAGIISGEQEKICWS